jgi:hypothetical protein
MPVIRLGAYGNVLARLRQLGFAAARSIGSGQPEEMPTH